LRIALALVVSGILMLAALAVLGWLLFAIPKGWSLVGIVLLIVLIGVFNGRADPYSSRGRGKTEEDRLRVRGVLDRLSMVAGIPSPRVDIVRFDGPLSWTTALRPSKATVHVTTALLDRLGDRELEAVLAHEVGHLVHRDAILMTMLAGPPSYLLRGLHSAAKADVRGLFAVIVYGPILAIPAALMLAVSRSLSRYREFAADRAAALLTGSPAAVASALLAVDDELRSLPSRDMRAAAAFDSFHFVPARRPRWFALLWATHPKIQRRLDRLERLERAVHQPPRPGRG
jgi:heat shock protein HtpX